MYEQVIEQVKRGIPQKNEKNEAYIYNTLWQKKGEFTSEWWKLDGIKKKNIHLHFLLFLKFHFE